MKVFSKQKDENKITTSTKVSKADIYSVRQDKPTALG